MKIYNSILSSEIRDFLMMRQASKCKSTYSHDAQALELLDRYLCEVRHPDKTLDEQLVTGWINTLTGKTRTIAGKVIVIRKFLVFLSGYGIRAFIPSVPKMHDDYVPYIFSDNELSLIFRQADSYLPGSSNAKYTLLHLQIPMILRLMYGCGLRVGEAVSIKMKDVDFDVGVITLRHPKGDKQRIVPMHDTLTAILHRYCCAAGLLGIPDAFIFGIPYGAGSVPTKAVKHRFDRILRLAGIDTPGRNRHERGACLHCLRHVFTFKSFEQAEKTGIRIDNAIPYLSIYLGHERIEETQKYLKFSSEMFPDALDRFGSFTSDIFPEVDYEE